MLGFLKLHFSKIINSLCGSSTSEVLVVPQYYIFLPILWIGAERGRSIGGNFRRRRLSTGPIPEDVLEDSKEVGILLLLLFHWSGSRAKMMSTSGPQVRSNPLASSIVRPRKDFPLTFMISSPILNRPSLEKNNWKINK